MPTGFPDYYGGLTLPVTVAEGGTGQTSITLNALLIGNGSGALTVSNVGTANQVFQVPSGGGQPLFQSLTINAGAITGIVPVANGGTGTATPALVAGSNIVITGSWPNETIALAASPSVHDIVCTPILDLLGVELYGDTTTPISPVVRFTDTTSSLRRGTLGLAQAINKIITGSVAGRLCLNADTGNLILGANGAKALTISNADVVALANPLAVASGGTGTATPALVAGSGISLSGAFPNTTITNSSAYATLADPLPIAHGGTGATTFKAAGIPQVVATLDLTAQTASIGSTTLYAVPASGAGIYLVAFELITTTAGTGGTVSATVASVNEVGGSESKTTAAVSLSGGGANLGPGVGDSPFTFYSEASQNITYSTTVTGATGNPQYSLRIRVIYLG